MKTKLITMVSIPFLLLGVLEPKAFSYPAVEMQACIANATNAVINKGISVTYKRVQQYCDCTLKRIIDERRDIITSINYCNKKYIL
jgi:hypothetical protein